MFWLLIFTVVVLGFLVAFETAFLFAIRGEYAAMSGMLRDANKRMVEYGLVDPRPFERQSGWVEQTEPDFYGDDLY